MLNGTRIKRLYIKDLLDILRDRRTLVTLVAVPIVLYPGLMLCFLQLGSIQADQIKEQKVHIGLKRDDAELGGWLMQVLNSAKAMSEYAERSGEEYLPPSLERWELVPVDSDLQEWVQAGAGHCALELVSEVKEGPWTQRKFKIYEDSAEIRSATAAEILDRVLHKDGMRTKNSAMERLGMPDTIITPVVIETIDVATAIKRGGSLLGQILPLVLVLMTITGAIYPAIDLTAGERERGTLETLVVCPVPVVEIIVGKFLVVATVSMLGAALNLASMGLTIHFGGLREALATGADTEVPVRVLPMILLCLVPLSVLFSALLLAVSSFAKSFKEAQSYVTPVIMGVLMPAGIAALPGTELAGTVTVMPVANMVLLTRELLLGTVDGGTIMTVLLSTCFYAATAVAIAVRVFGQEAVLFADSGSWRAQFDRHCIQPSEEPGSTLPLMYVALLFPIWLFTQNGLATGFAGMPAMAIVVTMAAMAVFFVALPWMLVRYYKINLANAFNLRWPRPRFVVAAVLGGLGSWAVVHELVVFQMQYELFGLTQRFYELMRPANEKLIEDLPIVQAIILLALVPALCEEFLFRGLVLSGLRQALRRWGTIVAVGLIFSVYHFMIQRFVVTFVLGALLAWICWQSRSILPAIIMHLMHNGITVLSGHPGTAEVFRDLLRIPVPQDGSITHLPLPIIGLTFLLVVAGVLLCVKSAPDTLPRAQNRTGPAQLA